MANFIAEVIGKDDADDGVIVTVRMTGVGSAEGSLMSRAKGRAIVSARFGRDIATMERTTDIEGSFGDDTEEITAVKDDSLFTGSISGVKDRIQAFRKDGVLAEVKGYKTLKTERVISDGKLEDTFGALASAVNTYEYEILVTTNFSFI